MMMYTETVLDEKLKCHFTRDGIYFNMNGELSRKYEYVESIQENFKDVVSKDLGIDIEPKKIRKALLTAHKQPITIELLTEILGTTIKRDDVTKTYTFLCSDIPVKTPL